MNQIIQNIRDRGYLTKEDLSQLGEFDYRAFILVEQVVVEQERQPIAFMLENGLINDDLFEKILKVLTAYAPRARKPVQRTHISAYFNPDGSVTISESLYSDDQYPPVQIGPISFDDDDMD